MSETIHILQITDTHLLGDPGTVLKGCDTRASLRAVLDTAQQLHWPPHLIVATGDLSHDGSPASYQTLHSILAGLGVPVYWIPGNHDEADVMADALDSPLIRREGSLLHGAWQILLLDTRVPGEEWGRLSPDELERLDRRLHAYPEHHTLIALHHQPVPVGSPWIDASMLQNPEAFFDVVDHHPHVRAIIWGHVHQEYAVERAGVQLLATPSTCIQFHPGATVTMLDDRPPGYRYLDLDPDGRISTGVERAAG